MRFDVLTLFPAFFTGPLDYGVLRRAIGADMVEVRTHDLRAFTHDRHRTVDDRPFGGGEGMVLKPEPIYECFQTLGLAPKPARDTSRETVVLLSAQGVPFNQKIAQELASRDRVVLLCGRYEGIDERINHLLCDRELSIGDYVLSGGELGAAVILDSVVRLLPGVLGNPDSARFESFGTEVATGTTRRLQSDGVPSSVHLSGGLLDYPHYTRPADYLGLPVPEVLQKGNHDAIRTWRRQMALRKTFQNRPDLLVPASLTHEDRKFLSHLQREYESSDCQTDGIADQIKTVEDHLRELEETMLRSFLRQNSYRLADLLTEDFEEFGSSGCKYDKQSILHQLRDESPRQLSIESFKTFSLSSNVVLATYISTRTADRETSQFLRSSIWVRQQGAWKLRFHQGTPLLGGKSQRATAPAL